MENHQFYFKVDMEHTRLLFDDANSANSMEPLDGRVDFDIVSLISHSV